MDDNAMPLKMYSMISAIIQVQSKARRKVMKNGCKCEISKSILIFIIQYVFNNLWDSLMK